MRLPKLKRNEFLELPPVIITSVCHFVKKDKDYLYTVSDRSQTEPVGIMRDLRIPIGCIKQVTKL